MGKFVYLNGNSFSGHWKTGEIHGNGTFQYKDGTSYSGEWKNGGLFNIEIYKTYTKQFSVRNFPRSPGQVLISNFPFYTKG